MLLLIFFVLLFLIGIFIGREITIKELLSEKEDRRFQYMGKVYKYQIEEEGKE